MSDLPFSFLLQVSLAEIICMDSMKPVIDFFASIALFSPVVMVAGNVFLVSS
jgi:hypothetical protein